MLALVKIFVDFLALNLHPQIFTCTVPSSIPPEGKWRVDQALHRARDTVWNVKMP